MKLKTVLRYETSFWEKVEKSGNENNCWLWKASIGTAGYGQVGIVRKPVGSHRVAWMLANRQDIPKGKFVLHSCDNKLCVNPAHLSIGTAKDNMKQMWERGRGLPGEKNPEAKLTAAEVKELRRLYRNNQTNQFELAKRFGVSQSLVSLIVNRRRWKRETYP